MKLTVAQARAMGLESPRKPSKGPKSKKVQESSPDLFKALAKAWGLPDPQLEYVFHETRKWRFDLAWPSAKVAVEIQGGLFSGGSHARGGFLRGEYEKLNEAQLAGWCVLLVLPEQVASGEAFALVSRAVGTLGDRS